jgi:hypothetical protein
MGECFDVGGEFGLRMALEWWAGVTGSFSFFLPFSSIC